MRRQHVADLVDSLDQCVSEFFIPEMLPHLADEPLPQVFAALLMDRFVADDRKLVRAGCHKDQNIITLRIFMQSEAVKSFLRGD
jgi:hypothetical protein